MEQEIFSNCCGASPWLNNEDYEICGACREHCDFETEEESFASGPSREEVETILNNMDVNF